MDFESKEYRDILGEGMDQEENCGQIKRVWFEIEGEPVPKDRPRAAGHIYTPNKTRDREEDIALMYKAKYHRFMFEKGVPLRAEMDFYFKIPQNISKKKRVEMENKRIRPTKRPDIDNIQKLVMDAANGVIWVDDAQVVEVVVRKYWSDRPRTEVRVIEVW